LSQSAGKIKLAGGLSCEDEIGMLGWLNELFIKESLHVNVAKKFETCNE